MTYLRLTLIVKIPHQQQLLLWRKQYRDLYQNDQKIVRSSYLFIVGIFIVTVYLYQKENVGYVAANLSSGGNIRIGGGDLMGLFW